MLSFMPFCVCVCVFFTCISYTITHTNKHSWPKIWLKSQIIVSILPLFLIFNIFNCCYLFISDKTQDSEALLPHYEHEDLFPLLGFRERVFFSSPSSYSFILSCTNTSATELPNMLCLAAFQKSETYNLIKRCSIYSKCLF